MNGQVKNHKLNWAMVKGSVRKELLLKKLTGEKTVLETFENFEALLKRNFPLYYKSPIEFLTIEKNNIKMQLVKFKNNKKLNSIEDAIINLIYDYLLNHMESEE